jgi:hypothetical protein
MLEAPFTSGETPPRKPEHEATVRLESEQAHALLRDLAAAGEIEKGLAHILSLDGVADRLGERWMAHRDAVYQQTERALYRYVTGQGRYLRVAPFKYLLIHEGVDRAAARARSATVLGHVFRFFFGAPRASELAFHEVTGFAGRTVFVSRVDSARMEIQDAAESPRGRLQEDDRLPFTVSDGRRVRVACALEPVYQIRLSQRIGYRLSRWVLDMPTERRLGPDDQRTFTRPDIERVDFAGLRRGLESLGAATDEREPSLILPVSYTTLSNHRSRSDLIELFRRAQQYVRHGLICEVCDIEGVPASALLAATAPIRPFCRFVVGHLETKPRGSLAAIQEAVLQGVSIDFPWADAADVEFIAWLRTFMAAVRPVARTAIVYHLDSLRHAAMAAMMGVSHASVRPPPPRPDEPDVIGAPRRREDETEQQMRLWMSHDILGGGP